MKKTKVKIDIEELKKQLKEKGLSHKDRVKEISKALDINFKIELEEIRASLDSKRVTLDDIQPYIASRQFKGNNDFSMRLKKSKSMLNRHCYR